MNHETDVQAWIDYAEADRFSACRAFEGADYRDVALHCQQALEKIIKAIIVEQTGQPPPYIHNLRRLVGFVSDITIPQDVLDVLLHVNPHYRMARYPGLGDPVFYVQKNVQTLWEDTERVYKWFMNQLTLAQNKDSAEPD